MHSEVPEKLRQSLDSLPASPGVYIMRDEAGKALYVGKAKSLRSRVRSYFQASGDGRVAVPYLSRRVEDIEVFLTDNEKEALILENNLIKKLRPRYNINLKDDKSFLCVRVPTADEFPMLQLVRRMKRDKAVYFGPFDSAASIRQTLSLLNNTLGLRVCKDRELYNRSRPCPLFEMDYCSAPCTGEIDAAGYRERVDQAIRFFKGDTSGVVARLESEMRTAAEGLDFERAGTLRDRITSVRRSLETQKIVSSGSGDRDVIGLHRVEASASIEVLYIRDGHLAAQSSYHIETAQPADDVLLAEFTARFYASDRFIPPEVHLPVEPLESEGLLSWLRDRRGGAVSLRVPQRGDGRRLLELATRNAARSYQEHELRARAENRALAELQEGLRLPEPPLRIDCFDIANTQGSHTVAAMSVLVGGLPAPTLYRHYKIQTVAEGSQDDFRAIGEVVARRYRKAIEEQSLPDLVLIDGGTGQLAQAEVALRRLGLSALPLASIAKGRGREGGDRIYVAARAEPVPMDKAPRGLLLLERARDEAHRFANRYHGKLRGRGGYLTGLEEIPGVGPRTISKLVTQFPTLQEMREATMEELQHRAGLTSALAAKIHASLHSGPGAAEGLAKPGQ